MGIKGDTIPIPKEATKIDKNKVTKAEFNIVSKKSFFSVHKSMSIVLADEIMIDEKEIS